MNDADALPLANTVHKPVGVIMLDTRFPRPVGDIGNPATWPFPVLYETVRGATARCAVRGGGEGLLEPFAQAGRRLVARGAGCLTTSCGFLAPFAPVLAERCGVPVAASSLQQVPWVAATLPRGRTVGVLTIAASALTPAILAAAGVPRETPVGTLEDGTFADTILNDLAALDTMAAEREHVAAARALVAAHPALGAIVLECTNMPPYAAAIAIETDLPVFSIVTLVAWLRG